MRQPPAGRLMTRAFHLLLLIGALLLARELVRGALAYWSERRLFTSRRWTVPRPGDALALGLVDVSFAARDGTTIRGWYIPSRNRAAVIAAQGSGGDRTAMLDDARALARAGFGVLLFDWPGTGESDGRITFGAAERAALEGAIDLLERRDDVDRGRIGALGFSMGGYTVSQVAAADTRLASVVLAGTFDDPLVQTRREYEPSGRFAVWGALLAVRTSPMAAADMRPVDVVARIAPRPLVVVAGSEDRTVPADLSRRLYDAAREPKELWLVRGAGHGGYGERDPDYHGRIARFFARTLAAPPTESVGPREQSKALEITSRPARAS